MKNLLNKDDAITLIALVVTIIILLILAGVTIGIATNGTGLFEKAKLATDEYNNKAQQEEVELGKFANNIEHSINGDRTNPTSLEWKSVNTTTGTTAITLPTEFNELYVEINSMYTYSTIIPYSALNNTSKAYYLGTPYIQGYNYGMYSIVSISKTSISLNLNYQIEATKFKADLTSTTTMTVLYR